MRQLPLPQNGFTYLSRARPPCRDGLPGAEVESDGGGGGKAIFGFSFGLGTNPPAHPSLSSSPTGKPAESGTGMDPDGSKRIG
jgi:hypothetical protein